jgi:hypothetical protein
MQLNVFLRKTDNKIKPIETTWDNTIQLFTDEHETFPEKHQAKLFNAAEYLPPAEIPEDSDELAKDKDGKFYTTRRQVNLIHNHLLVLDFDSDVTLEDALIRLNKYELVYYTSHSHLADGVTHKFRILIPFHKPIPTHRKGNHIGDWYRIVDSLKEFAGPGCDPKSFDPNQIYEMPSAPEERMHLAQRGHNKGTKLNWEEFEQSDVEVASSEYSAGKSVSVQSSDQHLDPEQILVTAEGPKRVKDVVGKIDGVVCPFHNDKKGSEFVRKVEHTENIFLYCKKCDRKYYMHRLDNFVDQPKHLKKATKEQRKPDRGESTKKIIEFDPAYNDASDRSRVTAQLKVIQKEIESDRGFKFVPANIDSGVKYFRNHASHIIYMPEGSGKSRLVIDIAKNGRKIIFACKSWEQAESKFAEFSRAGKEQGFKVAIVRSKDAKARKRFNSKVVRCPPKGPYQSGKINDEKSLERFIKNNPDLSKEFIRLSWSFFTTDEFAFESIPFRQLNEDMEEVGDLLTPINDSNTRVIVTSFEQLRIYKLKNTDIPLDWTIWFDDPDINDVIDIDPYDRKKWGELSNKKLASETKMINGGHYFKRNKEQSLGYPLIKHQCIYTTTESITRQAIELMMRGRAEKHQVHDQMDNITGGKITILGTSKVRRRLDGLIPALSRRLFKTDFPNTLIADGLAAKWNHSNNKGHNELSGDNLLVELSIPHDYQVRTICDALSLEFYANRRKIRKQIMLDRLHQAIGRNSGYRYEGNECVILVDKSFHKEITKETRYKVDTKNSVLIDKTARMSRLDSRLSNSASPFVKKIDSLLNNINPYVEDFRISKPDIKFILDNIDDEEQQYRMVIRVLSALCSYSDIDLKKEVPEEKSPQSKYRELSYWVLNTWASTKSKEDVLDELAAFMKSEPNSSWTGDRDKYNYARQKALENIGITFNPE